MRNLYSDLCHGAWTRVERTRVEKEPFIAKIEDLRITSTMDVATVVYRLLDQSLNWRTAAARLGNLPRTRALASTFAFIPTIHSITRHENQLHHYTMKYISKVCG